MIFRRLIDVVVSVLMLTLTLPAQTTTKRAEPGKSIKLIEDKQQIKVTKEPKNGKQEVKPPTDPDQTFKLFYTANDMTDSATDEIEYKMGEFERSGMGQKGSGLGNRRCFYVCQF